MANIARRWRILIAGVASVFLASATPADVPEVTLEPVVTLNDPLYLTHAGDDRLFIVQRNGVVWLLDPVLGVLPTPFLNISGLVQTTQNGGLFTLAFHPDVATNRRFFVAYTAPGLTSTVARYEISAGDPNVADAGSAVTLLSYAEPAGSHNVGQLAFGPDGFLYVGAGDGGEANAESCRAQQPDGFFGKILRLDVDQNVATPPYYGIPAGNPYESAVDGVLDEIWARGFRNPWRFSFDPDGDLWIADVGQDAREELDRQPSTSVGGENYGWKVMEGTTCFDPDPVDVDCPLGTPSCFDPAYTAPAFEYTTGEDCAITGGYVYRGSAFPELVGRYVFGDVCSARIWVLSETSPGLYTRELLIDADATGNFPLTSFGEDVDGELYVMLADDVVRIARVAGIPSLTPAAGALLVALLLVAARARVGTG